VDDGFVGCGSFATKWGCPPMSGLPPIATELRTPLEVRFVPETDIALLYSHDKRAVHSDNFGRRKGGMRLVSSRFG
jgi:hypothetical protein